MLALLLLASAPPPVSPTAHGDRVRDAYFLAQAKALGESALANIKTKADWAKQKPILRNQFLDMMGLDPLPKKSALKPVITGTITTPHYKIEKLHFQSLPGLYVSANLYLPKQIKGKIPAVLYVCGHGKTIIDKVSYGNKVTYQHHGAWFAEHGYACLIVDTLQLGEVQGLHHGLHSRGLWWWVSLGYTPAGIETWNAIRALDYLESRKEVDPKKIGVTGRSGGGATSWWIAAADERVQCIIPVAGIADLQAHVSQGYPGIYRDGVVAGHCDCMYFVNTYRWDYTQVIALCAPRPLMLGNSDADVIFPVQGYKRMTNKVKKLYATLGVPERFTLLETKGPHKDTPELRLGAFRWMNRWLKNDNRPVLETVRDRLKPQQLQVFARAPGDAINDIIHERFKKPAKLDLPQSDKVLKQWWPQKSKELKKQLLERVFRGWPEKAPNLGVKVAGQIKQGDLTLRAWDFTSEEGIDLRLFLLTHNKVAKPGEVIFSPVDEVGWNQWVRDLGPAFKTLLWGKGNAPPRPYPARDDMRLSQHTKAMLAYRWAYAFVAPRGVGPTRWSEVSRFNGKPVGHQIRRRFYLLGQTWEGQQVWDVRRAVACLGTLKEFSTIPLSLEGRGEMGVIGLYAAIFEPKVARVDLWHPPASHKQGPALLNVLTVLDIPQAAALVAGKVRIEVKDKKDLPAWQWPKRVHAQLDVRIAGD